MKPRKPLLGLQDFRLHEVGGRKLRTYDMDAQREVAREKHAMERAPLISAALKELAFTNVRDVVARKLYRGEPFTLEDWPALKPLRGAERTECIKEARHILGLGDPRPKGRN